MTVNEYQRRVYQSRVQNGRCPRCGGERDRTEFHLCAKCREYMRGAGEIRLKKMKENRKSGLCACGAEATPGRASCPKCRKRAHRHYLKKKKLREARS